MNYIRQNDLHLYRLPLNDMLFTKKPYTHPHAYLCFVAVCYPHPTGLLHWQNADHAIVLMPLLLTWINFNPSMDK